MRLICTVNVRKVGAIGIFYKKEFTVTADQCDRKAAFAAWNEQYGGDWQYGGSFWYHKEEATV